MRRDCALPGKRSRLRVLIEETMMKAHESKTSPQTAKGEEERDNDAQRPDGSSGTSHDSTAQKTARDKGKQQQR